MKKVKYVLWLIIMVFLGILIYQNQDYFFTTYSLKFKFITREWILPEMQNIAYCSIFLFLGLLFVGVKGFVLFFSVLLGPLLAGFKGFLIFFRLKKEIKQKEASISKLKKEKDDLKKELAPFTSDPYIQQGLEEAAQSPDPTPTQS
jgi:hypothetical protein